MARGYGMALLAAISVAYLIHSSSAQTNYTVGDTTGWTVPQNGAAFYSTWAANKTFKVGDILVFNFSANFHDVVTVTKADYDACSSSSPMSFTPPVRITINASGEHYFFCSIANHCTSGQKLMISASDASPSPAPQPTATPAPKPSTPTPSSSPSPVSTPPPASTPAPATPPVSTPPPASTPAPATPPVSTPPPASTPAPATPPVSTPPPASTPAPATPPVSTPPPASTPATGTPPVSTPPPASTPATGTPPPTTPAAPPPNSATSLGFAGFTTFLSIFVALCY